MLAHELEASEACRDQEGHLLPQVAFRLSQHSARPEGFEPPTF